MAVSPMEDVGASRWPGSWGAQFCLPSSVKTIFVCSFSFLVVPDGHELTLPPILDGRLFSPRSSWKSPTLPACSVGRDDERINNISLCHSSLINVIFCIRTQVKGFRSAARRGGSRLSACWRAFREFASLPSAEKGSRSAVVACASAPGCFGHFH